MPSVWDALDKGMLHALGGMELEGMRFHHTIGNSMKFKMYELFISSIFCLTFQTTIGQG